MEFFKKIASGGDGEKSSLFGGMKIKGPTAPKEDKNKANYAQSQTSLSFASAKAVNKQKNSESTSELDLKPQWGDRSGPIVTKTEQKLVISSLKKNGSVGYEAVVLPDNVSTRQEEHNQEKKQLENNSIVHTKSVKVQVDAKNKVSETTKVTAIVAPKEEPRPQTLADDKKKVTPAVTKKVEPQQGERKKNVTPKQSEKPKKSEQELIMDEITEYQLKVLNLLLAQKQIKERISIRYTNIVEASQTIAQWKNSFSQAVTKQCHFAEIEEYEQADRLSSVIETLRKKIDEKNVLVVSLQEQFNQQSYQQLNCLKTQHSNQKRLSRKIKLIQLQLEDDAAHIRRDETEKIQAENVKCEAEKKKIARIQHDIKSQAEQIAAYDKTYIEDLNSKRQPLLNEKANLETVKTQVEAQIQELEKKLKDKRNQLLETNRKIKLINEGIHQVEETFKEEGIKLKERKSKLQTLEREKDEMMASLRLLEDGIKATVKQMEDKAERKLAEARELGAINTRIEERITNFDEEFETKRVLLDSFIHNGKLVAEFDQKHKETKELIKQLSYKKTNVASEIVKLQEKRKQLKQKIPALQAEQKNMAAIKNFKVASVKKNQIKEANEEIEQVKKRIEHYMAEEDRYLAEVQQLHNGQKEYEQEQKEIKYNLAVSQYKFENEKLKQIKAYVVDLNGTRMENKGKYLDALNEQIISIEEQLKYIEAEYGLGEKREKDADADEQDANKLGNSTQIVESNQEIQADHEELVEQVCSSDEEVKITSVDAGEEGHVESTPQQDEEYNPPPIPEDTEESGYVPLTIE